MFGQIPPTQYDLRFNLLGIPVRVHPVFWLTSAFLAWIPQRPDMVVIRILCIFLAILVHEMGHAIVTRSFGWYPEIVLYFFGGYATSARHSTWKDIAVSAAGPAAGFLLYAVTLCIGAVLVVNGFGHDELITSMLQKTPGAGGEAMVGFFDESWRALQADGVGRFILLRGIGDERVYGLMQILRHYSLVYDAIEISLFINLVWNVMNLVPVLPLDGGQISREYFCWLRPRNGMEICIKVSMFASGAIALLALQRYLQHRGLLGLAPGFLALMFGYLCYQSYQTYQMHRRGYR